LGSSRQPHCDALRLAGSAGFRAELLCAVGLRSLAAFASEIQLHSASLNQMRIAYRFDML
jgi:hypothetical protein